MLRGTRATLDVTAREGAKGDLIDVPIWKKSCRHLALFFAVASSSMKVQMPRLQPGYDMKSAKSVIFLFGQLRQIKQVIAQLHQ